MTRWVAPSTREWGCGVMCIEHKDEEPSIELRNVDGAPRGKWCGLLTCGHIWTCPVCSEALRAERAERIVRAVGHLGGRWQMLTGTLRHRDGLPLKATRDGLMAAWRRTRQGGRIQRVWTERVSASVRAQEVTHGEHGWHPHFHVLLRTSEWDDDERDALQARWERAVARELGEHCRPDDLHGLVWSEPFDASRDSGQRATYLAKLGLETAGLAKEGRHGNRTPWDVARAAACGDQRSHLLWHEYASATRGKRMIELDDRAQAAAKRALELSSDVEESGEMKEVLRIAVKRDDVRAFRKIERRIGAIMAIVLRAAETGGEAAVREWAVFARANAWKPALSKAPTHETPQREAG